MRLIRKTTKRINRILNYLSPFIQKRDYLGYSLYYSKGTSLIERLNDRHSIYEPETSLLIIDELKNRTNPLIIDIGANIGLISLYALRNLKNAEIFAFEPGPHQYELFSKTIKKNKLESKIHLSNLAVSHSCSTFDFYIHDTKDASGDGLVDTQRAGKTQKIPIQATTLDIWWNQNSRPRIDLIKIDTEGAELWVLEGAKDIISVCRPIIITEVNNINYQNYPYTTADVYNKIANYKYKLYTLDRRLVTLENIESFQQMNIDTFICTPEK
jgi:FkbM family methyltransferase